jgi:hypothetical protein
VNVNTALLCVRGHTTNEYSGTRARDDARDVTTEGHTRCYAEGEYTAP